MPLLDLITPWAAVLAQDSLDAERRWREDHAALLGRAARQRSPHTATLPLARDPGVLGAAAARVADASLLLRLRELSRQAAEQGADTPSRTVLLCGDGEGEPLLSLPGDPAVVALFLEGLPGDALFHALARGQASLTRWLAPDSESPVLAHARSGSWDLWELARAIPLREWIYTVGVSAHLAQAVVPGAADHQLFGIRRGEWGRLRERERVLRELLEADLDQSGLGLLLRWLVHDTPASVRTVGGTVIPPGAGAYLGWRLTEERVARVGLRDALRLSA